MAKRKSERRVVKTPIKIYSQIFGEFYGTSRNISDSGIFVDIEPFVGLQNDKEQKMVFINSANKRVIFNVQFVRETNEGLAFRFIDFEAAGERYNLKELKSLWQIHKAASHQYKNISTRFLGSFKNRFR